MPSTRNHPDIFTPRPTVPQAAPGYELMPYQRAGVLFCSLKQNALLADAPGLGKAQPISEPVLTPDGWKTMGEIREGDYVVGSSGLPCRVLGVFPQGVKSVYRVDFFDGTFARACGDHLWAVQSSNDRTRGKPIRVKSTDQLASNLKGKWSVPLVSPVEYSPRKLPFPAYVVGVLLGDGSMTADSGAAFVPGVKERIPEEIQKEMGEAYEVRRGSDHGTSTRYSIAFKACSNRSPLSSWLTQVGMRQECGNKYIPKEYLTASVSERQALIQGLMDTDGTCNEMRLRFQSVSEKLVDGFSELVRSLGGIASKSCFIPTRENERPLFTVCFSGLDFNPFRARSTVPQKKIRERIRTIQAIVPDGQEECRCIRVDAPDHLYVTRDFILTHNTGQVINTANRLRVRGVIPQRPRILVVCPANLKVNWTREIDLWSGVGYWDVQQVDGCRPVALTGEIVVINYDILHHHLAAIMAGRWDILVCDESHMLKAKDTKRSKAVKKIAPFFNRKIFMTGTPIENRPEELWTTLEILDPTRWKNWMFYVRRYCDAKQTRFGFDTKGASNLEELNRVLLDTIMIRRRKEEVLTDLPPKVRGVVVLPAPEERKATMAEQIEAFDRRQEELAELRRAAEQATPLDYVRAVAMLRQAEQIAFEEVSRVRHEHALEKLPACVDYIRSALEAGQGPLIIACHHRDVVEGLEQGLEGYRVVKVVGGMSQAAKQAAVDAFQRGEADVFIGNIQAAGVGLTLTRANRVIFVEIDWVPGKNIQMEDRAHRIGQRDTVFVQHLVLDGSLDERIVRANIEKQKIIDRAIDGKTEEQRTEILSANPHDTNHHIQEAHMDAMRIFSGV